MKYSITVLQLTQNKKPDDPEYTIVQSHKNLTEDLKDAKLRRIQNEFHQCWFKIVVEPSKVLSLVSR